MVIEKITVKTFWKGEVGVSGIINDDGKQYKVKLEIKGNQTYGYSCSCTQGNSYKGMCEHGKYLLEQYEVQKKREPQRVVITSTQIRTMIREYTNREVSRIRLQREEETVEIIPILLIKQNEVMVEFRLKKGAVCQLKNLVAFTDALEQEAFVEYSKRVAFYHSRSVFTQESRQYVDFLMDLVGSYKEAFEQLQKSSYGTVKELHSLKLNKVRRDHFFAFLEGKSLCWVNPNGTEEKIAVIKENPLLSIKLEKEGSSGISITLDQNVICFSGEKRTYVKIEDMLYCCDYDTSRAVSIFLDQLVQSEKPPYRLEVQEREIPLFYERVLKKIQPYMKFELNEVVLDQYEPAELKAVFYFDSQHDNHIAMSPLLKYGEYSFHPVEDVHVPRTICRDIPAEFKISQVIAKYFKYHEHGSGQLIIQQDDDALYHLLTEGIEEFRNLGEVYLSDSCKSFKIVHSPQLSISIKTTQNWLDLSVDTGTISRAELYQILSNYKRKTSYYRLKSGEFVSLSDRGLLSIAEIIEQCGIKNEQLEESSIRLPMYRALYLDSVLKEYNHKAFYRDHLYKSVIRGMKAVEDCDFEVPQSLLNILRPYQITGFRWLKTLDHYRFGGILADDMGLGKTLQVIAVLLDQKISHSAGVSLVVCPASLVYNWKHELSHYAPSLKVIAVAGNAKERESQIKGLMGYEIAITSYDLLKRDIELYQNITFRFQIIDEAQTIKNASTQAAKAVKAVSAVTRFALTGTPIENHLGELWSIFDYLMPGFLFDYQSFRKNYEQPIVKEGDRGAVTRLHQMAKPFILRRLKRDVLAELPEKMETTIYSAFDEEQNRIYTANVCILREMLEKDSDSGYSRNKIQVLAELTKLRQLCCDPRLYYEDYKGESAKLETCMELLKNGVEGRHKILLFSQFTSMLELIGKRLDQEEIAFFKLTGSNSKEDRMHMVQKFQSGDVPVFLISLKAGGTGLNLTAADIVIHYDPWWNISVQNQATDRAHRIGQQKQVSVFQLIAKDTIEEQILILQQSKKQLAEQIITHGTVSLSSLTREDLIAILQPDKGV